MKKVIFICILAIVTACNKKPGQTSKQNEVLKKESINSKDVGIPKMYAGEDVSSNNASLITAEVRFLKEENICETQENKKIRTNGTEKIMVTFPVENANINPLIKGDTLQLCGGYIYEEEDQKKSELFKYKNKFWHVEYAIKSPNEYGNEIDHCGCYATVIINKIIN